MIYATIDVALQFHPKALRAGTSMYLWTFGMLWMRDQKESGDLPTEVALRCPWASLEENRAAAAELVRSGLWSEVEGGYSVLHYAKKNDTRDEIEDRISSSRDRQQRYRDKKAPVSVPHPPPLARESDVRVTRNVRMALGADADALAVVDDDREGVRGEPPAGVVAAYVAEAQSGARQSPSGSTPPPDDVPITPELLAACQQAGAPPPTREHVQTMLANRRLNRRQSCDWPGEVVLWMLRQRGFDRGRQRASPLLQSPVDRCWEIPAAALEAAR